MTMPPDRPKRGRLDQGPVRHAPNAEPEYLPDPPTKLEFGVHRICPSCRGKGKSATFGKCGGCNGTGISTR
jgi:hypothetical protein